MTSAAPGAPAPVMTESLHDATLRLLGLLTTHEFETELLQQAIETLTALLKTRYGAIGIVDEHGGLTHFVHTGIAPEQVARIGQLPQGRGLLGVVIHENHALRLDDMSKDPRSAGFPAHHPPMKSLLAVPISHAGKVYGRLYSSDKLDGTPFNAEDERLTARSADALALTIAHHRLQSGRRQAEGALHGIAQTLSAAAGEQFFRELVLNLAKALGVDYAFVGELSVTNPELIQTVAVCAHGRIVPNFDYSLRGTPCAQVLGKQACHYPAGAQKLFPDDHRLADMGIEAYSGYPLFDSAGRHLGMLVVMHTRPVDDKEPFDSILRICSARAAAELERRRDEETLRRSEENLRALAENANDGILVNSGGRHVFANRRLAEMLGYSPEEFQATDIKDLVHPDEYEKVAMRFRARMAGENVPAQYETVLVAKNGAAIPVELNAAKTVWQGQPAALVFVRDISARKQAEAEMHKLASAVEQTADSVVITDRDGLIEYVNPAFEKNTGFTRAEAVGRKPNLVKSGEHDAAFYRRIWDTILRGEPFREVFVNRRKNGTLYYEEKTITPLKNERGEITHFVSTGKDITERRQAENQITRLGRILDNSTNEIYVFRADSLRFMQVNQGAQKNLGYSLDELRALTPLAIKPDMSEEGFEQLIAPLKSGEQEAISFVTTHRRKDGTLYPVEIRLQLSRHETPPVFVAIVQDISERKHAEERLSYLAYYDSLTGLPNRQLLRDRLRQTMFEADRSGRVVAVMLLDLDRFKFINDTLGHEAGDTLLKGVAERLTACVRHGDTVARLGGDEFTVLLANVAQVDDVAFVTKKILEGFTRPFMVAGRELFVSPSIGITLYPLDDRDIDNLLKNADAAMYHAKESGRNTFQFFTAELNEHAVQRLELETALRHALERNEFLLHYQPLMDLKTGRLKGVEALLRWRHPQRGLVSPLDFIPLAEETGLIVPIGEWALRTACAQAQAWHDAGFRGLHLSVNISGRQFQQQNLTALVGTVLAETGLDPRCLNLELTESVLMRNVDAAIAAMGELGAIGVGFSIDDFGTGYSSLSYLKRFPIDVLKIDRSFVRDITTDPDDAAIVTAIMAMAHTLGIEVVAEGVETEEQLAFLRARGCDVMQGYYFSKPLDAAALTEMLQKTMKPGARKPRAGKRAKADTGAR